MSHMQPYDFVGGMAYGAAAHGDDADDVLPERMGQAPAEEQNAAWRATAIFGFTPFKSPASRYLDAS